MMIDIKQLRESYAKLASIDIERIATREAASLEPDAVTVLIEEIKGRNMNPALIEAIRFQQKGLTAEDVEEMKRLITSLPCPECGRRDEPLVGTLIRELKSFLILTLYRRIPYISCSKCGRKRRYRAIALTLLLGWWGFPVGWIRTPFTIIASLLDMKKREEQSNAILTEFVLNYSEEFEAECEPCLPDLVRNQNKG